MQTWRVRWVVSLLILASSIAAFGQVRVAGGQAPLAGQTRPGQVAHPQQEPCWKQVGISSAAIDEQKSIRRESRAQIEAVCQDLSLSEQQKKAKIHEIRAAEDDRLNALIPAEQRQRLKQCQQARASSTRHLPRTLAGPPPGLAERSPARRVFTVRGI
jgi:hypothetical protein